MVLARASVRDSRSIICDEATSSVGLETDIKVHEAMASGLARPALESPGSLDRDEATSQDESIECDVCIIGDGSSGTYAAIRLQQLGKSVMVVGKNDHHGEAGQQGVKKYTSTRNATATSDYVNLLSGDYPYLDIGFSLPSPATEDLVIPFHDFIVRHNLTNAVDSIAAFTLDMDDWLAYPALYTLKNVIQMIQLTVNTPSGRKSIKAKKVLTTIPPLVNILQFMNLDQCETAVFSQFEHSYLYPTLDRDQVFPTEASRYMNWRSEAAYGQLKLHALYVVAHTAVPDLMTIHFGSNTPLSDAEVQSYIVEQLPLFRQGQQGTFWTEAAFETHGLQQIWKFTEHLIQEKILKSLDG
ncbi:hypothetical protein N8T08_008478 [Aspergillus melleus]|uniref:Uncharacterized protein n=1 Tax=Aspergillus melleus TaxID=138277 RepID=A0ACC3AVC0_9EURO|nr:hypothetical protein N8T08_008478 [Aspergillus melleus]